MVGDDPPEPPGVTSKTLVMLHANAAACGPTPDHDIGPTHPGQGAVGPLCTLRQILFSHLATATAT